MTASRTRSPLRSGARRAGVAALVLGAVLGLSACDPKETGSAAVVQGTRITEQTVQQQAASILDVFRSTQTAQPDNSTLLTSLVSRDVLNVIVGMAAQKAGITIQQGQIDALIAANGGRAKLAHDAAVADNAWVPPADIDQLARTYLIQQALANKLAPSADQTDQSTVVGEYLVAYAKSVPVSVSPRYGTWDPTKLAVVPVSNDLSVPAVSSATPSPAAS